MTEIRRSADAHALADDAAALVTELAESSIAARGHFSIALSGGSTPKALYARLAGDPHAARIEWARVHVFWGDERCVPPDHPDSNYRMARETLLDHVPIPSGNIHRMPGEENPSQAAEEYARTLADHFDEPMPRFDLILLGMGDDGHTASLFPYSLALTITDRAVVAQYVVKLSAWRLTLTYPAINNAMTVAFLIAGAGKAEMLTRVLNGARDIGEIPSQGIAPAQGRLLFLVDRAAAAHIE
jgi:6-phosphogluconolactonase